MKSLLSIQIDNILIKDIFQTDNGYVIILTNNQVIFITNTKIGIFDKEITISNIKDFREIPSTVIHFLNEDQNFSIESGAYVH